VSAIVVHAIDELDLHAPSIGKEQARELENARKALAPD
jgi:hypothetical protein